MNIIFKNKGVLSLLDLTTMGDSSKRGDDTKIGQFDSGLKYALSILYRNGIEVIIYNNNSKYTFSSKVVKDDITNKAKELLVIHEDNTEWVESKEHITAFSPQLGHEWKLWMAVRECYSNCLDEDGEVLFQHEYYHHYHADNKVVIILKANDLLEPIIRNWNDYFLNDTPLYQNNYVKIYKNTSDKLKLYKNNILIYESNTKSKYVYDYKQASIDEMRVLNNLDYFKTAIKTCIESCNDSEFIKDYIFNTKESGIFEEYFNFYGSFSETWIEVVNNIFKETGRIECNQQLKDAFLSCELMNIGIKKLSTNCTKDYYWDTAKVEPIINKTEEAILTFEETVKLLCRQMNFELTYPIEESNIDTFVALPNLSDKVLYISKDLNKDNFWQLVKAQFRLESNDEGNYVFKKYVELLNK